jgi:hypothetical protein
MYTEADAIKYPLMNKFWDSIGRLFIDNEENITFKIISVNTCNKFPNALFYKYQNIESDEMEYTECEEFASADWVTFL